MQPIEFAMMKRPVELVEVTNLFKSRQCVTSPYSTCRTAFATGFIGTRHTLQQPATRGQHVDFRFGSATSAHAFRRYQRFIHSSHGFDRPEDLPHIGSASPHVRDWLDPSSCFAESSHSIVDFEIRHPRVLDISSSRPSRILLSTSSITDSRRVR